MCSGPDLGGRTVRLSRTEAPRVCLSAVHGAQSSKLVLLQSNAVDTKGRAATRQRRAGRFPEPPEQHGDEGPHVCGLPSFLRRPAEHGGNTFGLEVHSRARATHLRPVHARSRNPVVGPVVGFPTHVAMRSGLLPGRSGACLDACRARRAAVSSCEELGELPVLEPNVASAAQHRFGTARRPRARRADRTTCRCQRPSCAARSTHPQGQASRQDGSRAAWLLDCQHCSPTCPQTNASS